MKKQFQIILLLTAEKDKDFFTALVSNVVELEDTKISKQALNLVEACKNSLEDFTDLQSKLRKLESLSKLSFKVELLKSLELKSDTKYAKDCVVIVNKTDRDFVFIDFNKKEIKQEKVKSKDSIIHNNDSRIEYIRLSRITVIIWSIITTLICLGLIVLSL